VSAALGAVLTPVGGVATELWKQHHERRNGKRLVWLERLPRSAGDLPAAPGDRDHATRGTRWHRALLALTRSSWLTGPA